MRQKALLLAGMLITCSLLPLNTSAKEWTKLSQGDVVDFLLPVAADQPSTSTDKIIITGGKVIDIDTTGCSFGTHPVQHYTILDPTGARAPRSGGIIPVTAEPVRLGTRLGNLILDSGCTIGGVDYIRYQGTVE